jgi:hypothetical protein
MRDFRAFLGKVESTSSKKSEEDKKHALLELFLADTRNIIGVP